MMHRNLRSILRSRRLVLSLLAVAACAFAAGAAQATTNYGDVIGTNVTFNDVTETSTFGDPEPLFGSPSGVGNQLLFFPANFSASSSGGGVDNTGAQLQTEIATNGPLDTIDSILLTEAGDTNLTGIGTAATGTFLGIGGVITVLEASGSAIAPVLIPFDDSDVVYSPSNFLDLPGNPGTTAWTASLAVDVASVVPNATKVMLSLDNNLTAASEGGTSALIQKKVESGPAVVITVIPEPGTFALVGGGLLGLAFRARRRRA